MKISVDIRKKILLESFEILKSDYENRSEIAETVGKIAEIDIDMAMDMWKYILDSYSAFISNDKAFGITGYVIYQLLNNIGRSETASAIKKHPEIMEVIFGKSAHIGKQTHCWIK